MNRNNRGLFSINEAARYLGVSIATLRRWHKSGSFPATFVSPGGHRYYSDADLGKKTKGVFRLAEEWVRAETPAIPPDEFYCSTSDRFKTRIERMAIEMSAHAPIRSAAPLIASAAGEIGNNSYDHNLGNWPDVIGTFFAYDLGKRIVVLADRGVGVRATLSRIRPDLRTDRDALRVAFTEFVTGRAPEHRGNGLKYVLEALMQAGASLHFQSGDAILEIEKHEPKFRITNADAPIRGCLAMISF